jgi:hypothetical protein
MGDWMVLFKEFGLAGLLSGAGTILLFFVLKWTLESTKQILNQAAHEREIFQQLQAQWIISLNEHTAQARAFHDDVKQAHQFQREEHQKMLEMFYKLTDKIQNLCPKNT